MLSLFDGRWFARCDGCIGSWPLELEKRVKRADREVVIIELVAIGWEIGDGDRAWCLDCSRRRREVQPRPTSRGVRRRRRTK